VNVNVKELWDLSSKRIKRKIRERRERERERERRERKKRERERERERERKRERDREREIEEIIHDQSKQKHQLCHLRIELGSFRGKIVLLFLSVLPLCPC
jgi:septal ring factor EnvC (AmiA/AmiB activator)